MSSADRGRPPPTRDSNPWLSRSGADGQTNIFKQLAGGCCWFSIGSTCSFAKWAQTLERDNTVELIERLSLMCDLAAHWTCDWRRDNQRFRVRGEVWGLLPFVLTSLYKCLPGGTLGRRIFSLTLEHQSQSDECPSIYGFYHFNVST